MFFTKSLRTKILLLTLVPLALALMAVGIIGSYAYEKAAKDIVTERDAEFARALASQLSGDLSQYSQVLRGIAAEDDLRSMEPDRLSSALEEARNLLYIFDGGLVVYDSKGIALWSQPFAAERQGTAFPVASKLDQVRSTRKPAFSDVFKDEISDEDMTLIGVPIMGSDDEFKGILAGMCTLRYSLIGAAYADVLEFQAGRSGYAYLVDGNGQVIYHRYVSMVGSNLADTVPVERATGGETGAVLTEDATGETIIAGFAPVPGTGWGLITQERWENIIGPIGNYSRLFLGLLVAGGVLSCGLIFFFVGRVLRPIRDLTQGAQRVAEGDFDYTITANTGDEIQTLAQQFNTMADALKKHTASLNEEITTRKQAEEELRKHREHLEELVDQRTKELKDAQEELLRSERLATLGQFSGSISHELRNPLGVIDSSVYYLKAKLKDADKRVREHLDHIKSSVSSSTAIIESLLNLTRMKEPQLERLDLTTITIDAIATSKLPATVNIVQDFPEQEVPVDADGEQLRMASKNIIRNAVQAMDGKGTLTLSVRSTADKQAELSFTDTGPGITKENLEKVFQPLFSTKAKGIGFGLSIVRMIVDKHGGTVEAKSEPGKGATIIIRLPLQE